MLGRVTIFSLRKKRTDSLKVITSADAQFSAQNQVKGKREKKRHRVRTPFFERKLPKNFRVRMI